MVRIRQGKIRPSDSVDVVDGLPFEVRRERGELPALRFTPAASPAWNAVGGAVRQSDGDDDPRETPLVSDPEIVPDGDDSPVPSHDSSTELRVVLSSAMLPEHASASAASLTRALGQIDALESEVERRRERLAALRQNVAEASAALSYDRGRLSGVDEWLLALHDNLIDLRRT